MKDLLTPKQQERKDRNRLIRSDYDKLRKNPRNAIGEINLLLRKKYGKPNKPLSLSKLYLILKSND